jgi:hypothetical protein
MQNLHYSIDVNAPKEKVWDKMLGKDTFPEWTNEFAEGSHYVGNWNKESRMRFLAPDDSGGMSGMISIVEENKPYEYVSLEHIGIVRNGKVDISSKESEDWAGAHENYTFKEENGTTKVLVDVDTNDEFKDTFQKTWPKALKKLKKIAEK